MAKQAFCKHCKAVGSHYSTFCIQAPKKPLNRVKRPKQIGKQGKAWISYRKSWLERHPQEYFTCGICLGVVGRDELTLDHKLARSSHPELRYVDSNIQPAHYLCNSAKGSKKY